MATLSWADLTVPNAEAVRDFYAAVAGWKWEPVDMGGYSDFVMLDPASDKAIGGICHARGENAGLPPHWLIYIDVTDIYASVRECVRLGGAVLTGPGEAGEFGSMALIRDPAGACAMLRQPPAES